MRQRQNVVVVLVAFLLVAVCCLTAQFTLAAGKGDPKAAMATFKKNCERCHGPEAKGDGPAGKFLKVKPADWTDKSRMSKLTDAELTQAITKGGGAVGKSPVMPPFGDKFTSQEIENLIALIRQLEAK
jgi:mono/diheme cytochrome c family protein